MSEKIHQLFSQKISVLNIGIKWFSDNVNLKGAKAIQLEWKPPASGNIDLINILKSLYNEEVEDANQKVIEIIQNGHPKLIGLGIARDVIPGFDEWTILHAGPPIEWDLMCGPMKGAVIGGLIYEQKARTKKEAEEIAKTKVKFSPCHHFHAVGPMAGIITSSMPVWIIENSTYGNKAFATLNEGLGKVLRYGAFSTEVIERLNWMRDELYPILRDAIEMKGYIDLRSLIAQALQMGDECHNRNKAITSLFYREIAPFVIRTKFSDSQKAKVLEFINSNDHFGLNLSMPACKSIMEPAEGIPKSTVITTMARNGVEFGIKVSAFKDIWFTAPSPRVRGLYFPGFTEADAALDLGDSVITETSGIGGFAMATAPAIVGFVGGSANDALNYTKMMYQITLTENKNYQIPILNFRGTPTGIDLRKVIETGILPIINTGIAHKNAGVGQVGAGLVNPPVECFEKALRKFKK